MASFDPAAAAAAYLNVLPPEVHAKASAYTHGREWQVLFGWMVAMVVAWLIVRSGVLSKVRNGIEGSGSRKPLLVALACAPVYILISTLLSLPWDIYTGWWYEKKFGLTSQALGGFLAEGAIQSFIGLLVGTVFFFLLYLLMRVAPKRWWLWGAGVSTVLAAVMFIAQPILIEPMFNKYEPAPPGQVRDEVVALGKATGTPTDKIFIYNGSKQSNRYTANVSGMFGSARVAMSDVMFKKGADIAEVRGVVGHEMGHYVHQHSLWFLGFAALMSLAGFWLADRLFPAFARAFGSDARGIGDAAGLPVLMAILSTLIFLGTPLLNSMTRIAESDADSFSLQYAHEPDGLSKALVKTLEYRAARPNPIEEIVFYDHPSVYNRVLKAMKWKAAHMTETPAAAAAPAPAAAGAPSTPAG